MKEILKIGILVGALSFLGCSNSIISAGEKIADMGGNYKANRFVRLYSDSIYQDDETQKVTFLSNQRLTYGEKSLILEDLYNDFIKTLGYSGKRVIFKPVNGNEFCYTYSKQNGEVLYIPVTAFKKLPYDTLPFVTMAVVDSKNTNYYLTEKTSFIKKIGNPTIYSKNINMYRGNFRAKLKENIRENTNEMAMTIADKKEKISIDEIKAYLIKNGKM